MSALTLSSPAVLIIIVLSYLLLYSYQFDSNLFAQVDGYYSNNLGLVKILVDKAIQTFQNNSTKDTITHLREAYAELMVSAMDNNIKNKPAGLDALAFILGHTIKLLSENNATTLPNNSSILYLNTLEEQLGQYLPAISSNIENSINRTASTIYNTSMRRTTQDDKTEKVGITLPISLVKQIEKMRGDIPRSYMGGGILLFCQIPLGLLI